MPSLVETAYDQLKTAEATLREALEEHGDDDEARRALNHAVDRAQRASMTLVNDLPEGLCVVLPEPEPEPEPVVEDAEE